VAENRPERALGDLFVVRHGDPAIGFVGLAKHDVASLLPVDHVARLFERSDQITAGDDRKPDQLLDLDNLFGYRRRHWVAVLFQALQIQRDGFAYV